MTHRTVLSDDGLTLTVLTQVDGVVRKAVYERSPETGPFDDAAIAVAVEFAASSRTDVIPGQRSTTRRLGRHLKVHVAFGPPTWWLPRAQIKRDEVMVGWLRGLVAVWWSR